MGRRRIPAGEIGTIHTTRLATGWRARAQARDGAGELHQLRVGGNTLDALTVGRCDRIIQAILLNRSIAAARRARSVLALSCGYAVRDNAMPRNPRRDVQRLPLPAKKTALITTGQIAAVCELQHWRESSGNGPRPDYRALIGRHGRHAQNPARVGECIGLRRCDVDMTSLSPTVLINGTIVQTKEDGVNKERHRARSHVGELPTVASNRSDAVRTKE